MKICVLTLSFFLTLAPAQAQERVAVLFGSYGDIDNAAELEGLVKSTLTDPDVLGLPAWLSGIIAHFGWKMEKQGLYEEYEAIGGASNMRANAQRQADAVAAKLSSQGIEAKGFIGFTMTSPSVADAMIRIRAEGFDKIVVLYHGAQYSHVTAQIVFRHVNKYLQANSDWSPEVTGVRSFSDERFADLLISKIQSRLELDFSEIDQGDMCIFLPMHGNVMSLVKSGDPYVPQTEFIVESIRNAFPAAFVSIGYQNHDEIPFVAWTQPDTDKALTEVAKKDCKGVLINGAVSFTVDSLETLYDHTIDEPNFLRKEISRLGQASKKIFVEPMLNDDPDFVDVLGDVINEALNGVGDIEQLRAW